MKKVIILSALLIFSAGQVSLSAPKVRKVKKTESQKMKEEIDRIERKNCILCGYCSEVCPVYLMPMKFEEFYRKGKYKKYYSADERQ